MLKRDHQLLLLQLVSPSQAQEGDLGESKCLKLNAPVMQGTFWNNCSITARYLFQNYLQNSDQKNRYIDNSV